MAYNPIVNAFRLSAEESGGNPSYFDSLIKGLQGAQVAYDAAYKPKNMAEALLGQQLQNKINAPRAERAGELVDADLKSRLAQASRAQQLASQPFGGMLSGVAREAYAIDLLKNKFGADSEIYQNAKRSYDASLSSKQGMTDYRNMLANTAGARSLSSFGKLSSEQSDVDAGFLPGTNRSVSISPEQQEELRGQYGLLRQKSSTDADTRRRTLLATNIDNTIDSIDTKDLTRFAGLNGQVRLRQEEAKAATNPGSESKAYQDYLVAANNAALLSKQVRQFYGDSIQPSMLEKLDKLSNPATWRNNPEIATKLYNSFTNILKKETGTYRSALKGKSAYEAPSNNNSDPLGLGL